MANSGIPLHKKLRICLPTKQIQLRAKVRIFFGQLAFGLLISMVNTRIMLRSGFYYKSAG